MVKLFPTFRSTLVLTCLRSDIQKYLGLADDEILTGRFESLSKVFRIVYCIYGIWRSRYKSYKLHG